MITRRTTIQSLGAIGAGTLWMSAEQSLAMGNDGDAWFMPDECEPHQRTWMAFGASKRIWGNKLLPRVQQDLAAIALAIAKYEPVSMLVRQADLPLAQRLMGDKVELLVCPLNDLWMRDIGPVFVVQKTGDKAGVDFNFNGWGEKQDYDLDSKVAAFVTQHAAVRRIETELVLEGGGIEVDGHGTAIITESCVLNKNRNPDMDIARVERELNRLLGLKKIIWLPGIKGKDITDGHTDFYARFARPGMVIAGYDPDPQSFDHALTKRHIEILRAATDTQGRKLEVVVLEAPGRVRDTFANDDFAAGYINFYVCNGAVIAPEFGDPRTDAAARGALQKAFPGREMLKVPVNAVLTGGRGIHCTTQQEPRV